MGKSGDTAGPAVSLSPCKSLKLVEEGKDSLQPRNGVGSGGCVVAALAHGGAVVYQLVPFPVLEVQQEKDDVQTSLQCVFLSGNQTFVKSKC